MCRHRRRMLRASLVTVRAPQLIHHACSRRISPRQSRRGVPIYLRLHGKQTNRLQGPFRQHIPRFAFPVLRRRFALHRLGLRLPQTVARLSSSPKRHRHFVFCRGRRRAALRPGTAVSALLPLAWSDSHRRIHQHLPNGSGPPRLQPLAPRCTGTTSRSHSVNCNLGDVGGKFCICSLENRVTGMHSSLGNCCSAQWIALTLSVTNRTISWIRQFGTT